MLETVQPSMKRPAVRTGQALKIDKSKALLAALRVNMKAEKRPSQQPSAATLAEVGP